MGHDTVPPPPPPPPPWPALPTVPPPPMFPSSPSQVTPAFAIVCWPPCPFGPIEPAWPEPPLPPCGKPPGAAPPAPPGPAVPSPCPPVPPGPLPQKPDPPVPPMLKPEPPAPPSTWAVQEDRAWIAVRAVCAVKNRTASALCAGCARRFAFGVVIVTFASVTEEPLIARSPYTLEPGPVGPGGTVGASVTWSRVTPVSPSASTDWTGPRSLSLCRSASSRLRSRR